jgi:ribose transport system permease protein
MKEILSGLTDIKGIWKKFISLNGSGVFLALIVYIIAVAIIAPQITGGQFITWDNIIQILRKQTYIGIIACALTLVMITGNIDLSVGSILSLTACIAADSLQYGWVFAIIFPMLVGGACGLINGLLVSRLKLNSFITTIGTGSIFGALAILYVSGYIVPSNESETAVAIFKSIGQSFLFGIIPMPVIIMLAIVLIFSFLLKRTVFGTQLYAIGANPVAARLSGIRSMRNVTIAYVLSGLVTGLSAVIMVSRIMSAQPQVGFGQEMDVILAVVLGGTSVLGGKGSMWGTVLGFIFLGFLTSGFVFMGMTTYTQWVIEGLILVIALSFDISFRKGGPGAAESKKVNS